MLATALRGNACDSSLENLQHRLLDALAGYVSRNRSVVGFAGNLVDLIDIDDAAFGALHVEICRLKEVCEDTFDVLTHVTGLCKRSRIGDRKGNVQNSCKRPCEQRLSSTRGPDKENIRFLQFDVAVFVVVLLGIDPLVVIVDSNGQCFLRTILPHYVDVESLFDLEGGEPPVRRTSPRGRRSGTGLWCGYIG